MALSLSFLTAVQLGYDFMCRWLAYDIRDSDGRLLDASMSLSRIYAPTAVKHPTLRDAFMRLRPVIG